MIHYFYGINVVTQFILTVDQIMGHQIHISFLDMAMASSRLDNHYPWYAIDGKISTNADMRVFATEYQLTPYFMLQLAYLTNVIGVTITSRNTDDGHDTHKLHDNNDASITKESGTQSINGVEVRVGTIKVPESLCENIGDPLTTNCSKWEGNEFCGVLTIDGDILPLREYSIRCGKSIPATFVTLQLPTIDNIRKSLTFEEVTLILGNFLKKEDYTTSSDSIHGSSGIIQTKYIKHYC